MDIKKAGQQPVGKWLDMDLSIDEADGSVNTSEWQPSMNSTLDSSADLGTYTLQR